MKKIIAISAIVILVVLQLLIGMIIANIAVGTMATSSTILYAMATILCILLAIYSISELLKK